MAGAFGRHRVRQNQGSLVVIELDGLVIPEDVDLVAGVGGSEPEFDAEDVDFAAQGRGPGRFAGR